MDPPFEIAKLDKNVSKMYLKQKQNKTENLKKKCFINWPEWEKKTKVQKPTSLPPYLHRVLGRGHLTLCYSQI